MTALGWYKILLVTEFLTVETLITLRFERRRLWGLRALIAVLLVYLIAFFFPIPSSFGYSGWYLSILCLALFATTFAALMFVHKITVKCGLFCAIMAYTVQHLSYEIFTLFSILFSMTYHQDIYGNTVIDFSSINPGTAVVCLVYLDIFVFVCGFCYFFMRKYLRENTGFKVNGMMVVYSAGILLIDIVLNAFVVYVEEYNAQYETIICIFNVLCCVLVFYIQIAAVKQQDSEKEIEGMSAIIAQMHKQYELSRSNIDLINRKCHDLKYQFARLRSKGTFDEEEIRSIEEAIDIYDRKVQTGNDVLDVILTEKNLLCRSKNIKFSYMADCARLTFLREGELYALFGNLMDNAIEAVMSLDDPEKRVVGLNIHAVGEMVSITVENYFEGELEFNGALPKTRKEDAGYHGYGLLSVKSIVESHGGDLSISAAGGVFTVTVLLPIPSAA